jgi:hypothetical protein
MKSNNIHTLSIKGFSNPVNGQAYWTLMNDAECVHYRGIHI